MITHITVELDCSKAQLNNIRELGIDEFWAQLEQRPRDSEAKIISIDVLNDSEDFTT